MTFYQLSQIFWIDLLLKLSVCVCKYIVKFREILSHYLSLIAETTTRFKSTKPDNLNRLDSDTGRDQLFHPEVWIQTVLNSCVTVLLLIIFS